MICLPGENPVREPRQTIVVNNMQFAPYVGALPPELSLTNLQQIGSGTRGTKNSLPVLEYKNDQSLDGHYQLHRFLRLSDTIQGSVPL